MHFQGPTKPSQAHHRRHAHNFSMQMSSDYEDNSGDDDLLCSEVPETLHHPYYCKSEESAFSVNDSEFYGRTTSSNSSSEAQLVASHYNARPNTAPAERTRSAIIHLREFHNWVKSVLIREFVSQRKLKVLDLACGKGGDLMKWDKADVSVLTGVGNEPRQVSDDFI